MAPGPQNKHQTAQVIPRLDHAHSSCKVVCLEARRLLSALLLLLFFFKFTFSYFAFSDVTTVSERGIMPLRDEKKKKNPPTTNQASGTPRDHTTARAFAMRGLSAESTFSFGGSGVRPPEQTTRPGFLLTSSPD